MSIYIFNIGLGGRESAFLFLGNIWGGKWVWLTEVVNKPHPRLDVSQGHGSRSGEFL
jgi:hypothetical protein